MSLSYYHISVCADAVLQVGSSKLAMQDVVLSDGTILPKGTLVSAPLRAIHHDDEHYPDADTFKPSRFYNEADETSKLSMTTTTPNFLIFGHGKTAW